MTVFRVDNTTFHRRRLQAQRFYVQLIHKGLFHHDIERAYQVMRSLQGPALIEATQYLFRR